MCRKIYKPHESIIQSRKGRGVQTLENHGRKMEGKNVCNQNQQRAEYISKYIIIQKLHPLHRRDNKKKLNAPNRVTTPVPETDLFILLISARARRH